MTVYQTLVLETSDAKRFAEAGGVIQDLSWCKEVCDEICRWYAEDLQLLGNGPPAIDQLQLVLEAFSISAVVRYARCFEKGKRPRLAREILDELPTELREDHDYFWNLRRKHYAHSVNPYEFNRATITVPVDVPAGYCVDNVGTAHARLASIGPNEAEALAKLAVAVRDRLMHRYVQLRDAAVQSAQTLTPDDLASLKHLSVPELRLTDVGKDRDGAL